MWPVLHLGDRSLNTVDRLKIKLRIIIGRVGQLQGHCA